MSHGGKHIARAALAILLFSSKPSFAAPSLPDDLNNPLFNSSAKETAASLAVDFNALLGKAEKGDADAQQQVGAAYCNGRGVAQDYQQARIWLQKAAEQKNLRAISWLGFLSANGYGVPQDQAKAFQYYLTAAMGGNDVSDEMQVAERYARGNGVNASDVESLSWYDKAAAHGNAQAALEAGLDYFNGKGSTKDPETAFRYFLQASYHDLAPAQYYLAYFYWNGIFVPRDPVQAYKWIQLANRRDHEEEATTLLRDIKAALTVEQVTQGEALVDGWSREMRGEGPIVPLHSTFATGSSAKMPFENIAGEIVLTTTINGHDKVKFILDTGASLTIIDGICVSQYKIPTGTTYRSFGGIGKDTVLGSHTADLSLALPGLTFDHVSLDIAPCGARVDGILGYDLLRNFVIKIDYVAKTVEFMDPKSFNASQAGQLLPARIVHTKIFVQAKLINSNFESDNEEFVLDTGCSDGFVLAHHYVLSYPNLAFAKGWEGAAEGIGGTLWAERVPCFGAQVGDILLKKPIVTVAKRDQSMFQHMNGLIGNEVWKYFDLTIDYPGQRVYLKPNSHYETPPAPPPVAAAVKPAGPD